MNPPLVEQVISLEGHILEGQTLQKQGHEVRVTVMQGGQSKNGFSYDQPTLQNLAQLLEGAQAYADHDTSAPVRSVRDMVGFYTNASYMPPDSSNANGRVDATLHILEAADWLWSIIYESVSIGKPDLVGLSVDIFGTWSQDVGSSAKHVTGIRQINSCDIVTRPSAGGAFQRIIHSHSEQQGDSSSMDPITLTPPTVPLANTHPASSLATNPEPEPTPPGGSSSQRITEQQQQQQDTQVQSLLQQLQLERAQLALERRLLGSVLPQAVTTPIRERYSGRIFEMADLERDLTASQHMMATLASQGIIRDNGYERPEIGSQITEAEKVQAAFDLMFEDANMKMLSDSERTRFAGVRAFTSIREAYARATGDPSVSGSGAMNLGPIRVSEHAPVGRITEADTTTASFSYLLGTSMNKRLLKDYQAWPAEWVRFCTIVPTKRLLSNASHCHRQIRSLP